MGNDTVVSLSVPARVSDPITDLLWTSTLPASELSHHRLRRDGESG